MVCVAPHFFASSRRLSLRSIAIILARGEMAAAMIAAAPTAPTPKTAMVVPLGCKDLVSNFWEQAELKSNPGRV